MKIHFIPNDNIDIGTAICYIHPKDLEILKEGVVVDDMNIINDEASRILFNTILSRKIQGDTPIVNITSKPK